MAAGLKAPAHLDAVFENVSDQFHCPFAESKTALRDKAQDQLKHLEHYRSANNRLALRRDFARKETPQSRSFGPRSSATFGTLEAAPVFCKATFDYQPAHGWRMRELEVHGEGPLQGMEMP